MKNLLSNKHYLTINLHFNGNTSFCSNIIELSKSYDLPDFVPSNLDKSKISRFKDIIKQKYNIITQWRYLVNREIKIHVYRIWQTANVSGEFLRIENKQLKKVQNDSCGQN